VVAPADGPYPAPSDPPGTSLRYLDGLLRNAGGVMYVRDAASSRFVMVNPAFEELVGLPLEQILGRTGHDLFPPEVADVHRENDLQVLADGIARTSSEWAPHPDGTMHEYVSHKFALVDESGEAYAIGGISTDVTDLRASEADLRDAEARFQAVFTHAPIGQIFSELDGRVSAVNEALAAMLGYRAAEMIGRRIADFAEPEVFASIRQDAAHLLDGGPDSITAIRRFLRRDGGTVPVRVTSALLRDQHGGARWWVSMVANLTEEERNRTELENAHAETLTAARRLTLLNAVAGAANDSVDLERAAGDILAAVCGHFGWRQAALVRAAPGGTGPVTGGLRWTVPVSWSAPGSPPITAADLVPASLARLAEEGKSQQLMVQHCSGQARAVLLPLSVADRLRYVLVFRDAGVPVDSEDEALLRLIALESTRLAERQAAQEQLAGSEQRFRSIFAGSPLPMALTLGTSTRLGAVNAAMCQLLGRSEAELLSLASAICDPADPGSVQRAARAAAAAPDGRTVFGLQLWHADGSAIETVATITALSEQDGSRNMLLQLEDVTARRAAELSLRRQAEEDPLTGLANRAHLNRLLLEQASASAGCLVLFIDLDGFKLINDSCGHEVGDEVLIEVARRLRSTVRPTDTVARLGGDEFVVLCPEPAGGHDACQIAQRLTGALEEPILTTAGPVRVTASVGIADGRIPLADPTELLHRADVAMYRAKRLGKDRSELYDTELHRQAISRARTETALRTALDDGRFTIHYQPIVKLATGRVVGFEALVRLVDEDGMLVAPDSFIAVAEQSGLIIPMGGWVLRQACRTVATLRRTSGMDLFIAVNVAASQVGRQDLIATVDAALVEAGLPERALSLELTESALLEADARTLDQLTTLRSAGVHIALDDFGTGYSSLAYLRTFPVTHLKVDRSFTSGIAERSGDLAIVRAIAGMAHDLGLGCVAEGVETEQQRRLIDELGVPYGQGYLFAKPVAEPELFGLLRRSWARPSVRLA